MKKLQNFALAMILTIGNFTVYAQTATETTHKSASDIFLEVLIIAFIFGIPFLVAFRKIRRKIKNFKEDVKSEGFGEATMSRLEDHFDRKRLK